MTKTNLIKLSDKLNDGTKYTPLDMVEVVIERLEKNPKIKKAIILLWDETAEFARQVLWHQSGLTKAEHLYLLSRAKDEYLVEFALDHTHGD